MSLTRVTINKKIKKGKKKYSTFLKRKLIHGLSIDQLKKAVILKHGCTGKLRFSLSLCDISKVNVQCYYKSSKYIFLSLVNASSVSVKRIIAGHALISFLSRDKYIEQSSSIAFAIYNIARALGRRWRSSDCLRKVYERNVRSRGFSHRNRANWVTVPHAHVAEIKTELFSRAPYWTTCDVHEFCMRYRASDVLLRIHLSRFFDGRDKTVQ